MMRVVVGTNVFVSTVLGGRLAVITDLWREGRLTLIASDEIVREYIEDLRRPKFQLTSGQIDAIAAFLLQRAQFVTPATQAAVITADPDDNKYLDAAVAGQAEYLVSGDYHLLELGTYQSIRIVTAREFFDLLQAQPPRLTR